MQNNSLSKNLHTNLQVIKDLFKNDSTLKIRIFQNESLGFIEGCIIHIDGMVDNKFVSENVISPFLKSDFSNYSGSDIFKIFKNQIVTSNELEECTSLDSIVDSILEGDTVFLLNNSKYALIIGSKNFQTRSVTEPTSEKVLRGPREGFTECLLTNISLIRRKIKNPNLKFQFREIGEETNTRVCICHIEGIASNKILNELIKRLDSISINSVLDSQYIQEIIDDLPLSPFETINSTERPDAVAGKLLEGRIAVFVDGSPFVLTLPFLFIEYFQVDEDYYNNFVFMSFNRLLRILAFILSISIPSIYLSLVTYNQEMIPTPLLISISAARLGVPFPTVVESFIMLLVFEILREAGERIPNNMGQAVSIVGGLVLGQAAVEARIVSAPMVIVVGLTGICGLLNIRVKGAAIFLRFFYLILSSLFGMYGYIIGLISTLIYLMSIYSFGVPYMTKVGSIKFQNIRDSVVRAPWWYLGVKQYIIGSKLSMKNKRKTGYGDENK